MIKKSVIAWLPVVMRLQTEGAVDTANEISFAYNNILVWYIKSGGVFTEKVLTAADFDDCIDGLGTAAGIAKIKFTAAELDTVGKFIYWVDGGATARLYYGMEDVVENTNDDIAADIVAINNKNFTGIPL